MAHPKKPVPLPTRQQLLDFIKESPTPVGKREIARAFDLRGGDKIALKALLKELAQSGEIERGRGRRMGAPGALPELAVLVIVGPDADGELIARPARIEGDGEPPIIAVAPERRGAPALGAGDRILARLKRVGANSYEAQMVRLLGGAPERIIGIYELRPDGSGRLRPTDRRIKDDYRIAPEHAGDARPGDLVAVEALPRDRRSGRPAAEVVERIGRFGDPKTISLISIAEHDIPSRFAAEAIAEAEAAGPVALGRRTDLRDLPLVTIDGEDARDFDDAVWAGADDDPANQGGWQILVAIADVAHYVRNGSALDRTARERGNSVYFPDRVVPMLPEALSNGWCSLKPKEDRSCLAVRIQLDARGRAKSHRFYRGLMRSAARLTYAQVQEALDGRPDEITGPLLEPVLKPLQGAYRSLLKARADRGTLELDLPERRVYLGADGKIERIVPRERYDSHKLIEEFMIAANVAAAEALEAKRKPAMYRVHDQPDPAKIDALRESLSGLGLPLAKGQVLRPKLFTDLLLRASQTPQAAMVHDLVLRSQSQAVYSPNNIGHFGLALSRYCHFTSPIRRYSDLLVHRALIDGFNFGDDGLPADAEAQFSSLADHISKTERRAAAAERDALDRYVAVYLSGSVGQLLPGRINGVTRFGLFVTLDATGASGLVPIGSLPQDYYDHDERAHALVGRRWGRIFRLGETGWFRLIEADPVTGGLILNLIEGESADADGPTAAPVDPRGHRREHRRAGAKPAGPATAGKGPRGGRKGPKSGKKRRRR